MDRCRLFAVSPILLLFWLCLGFGLAPLSYAEPPGSPASAPPPIAISQIQAKLEALAADTKLSASERDQAKELYQQAIAQLQAGQTYAQQAEDYQAKLQSAPLETARLRQAPDEVAAPQPPTVLSVEQATAQLTEAQLRLSGARKRLADIEQQQVLQRERPKQIPTELEGRRTQQAALANNLQATRLTETHPLLADARQLLLNAQYQALGQQITLLEREQLSHEPRLSLLNAQHSALVREIADIERRVQRLQELLNDLRRAEAATVVRETAQASEQAAAKPPVVQAMAQENATLSQRLQELVRQTDAINVEQNQFNQRLNELTERMHGIKQRLSIAGFSDALGPLLLQERRRLPDVRQYEASASERRQTIIHTRLEQYQVDERLRDTRLALADPLAALGSTLAANGPPEQRQTALTELRTVLTDRQQLLEKLATAYASFVTQLVVVDDGQRKLSEQAENYGQLLDRYLLWVRSSPSLDLQWFHNLQQSVRWLITPTHWRQVGRSLGRGAGNVPLLIVLGGLALLGLTYYRRRLIALLVDVDPIGDVRNDSFWLTVRALGITILLALFWPGLLAGLAGLLRQGGGTSFAHGLSQGLLAGAFVTLTCTFLRQLCRPQGVAIAHFHWNASGCRFLRRHLGWFLWIGPPSVLVTGLCSAQPDVRYDDTIGRLAFCIGTASLAVLLWRVLAPSQRLLAELMAQRAGAAWRLRHIWYPLIVGGYGVLTLLALTGYYYTAFQLRDRLALTAWLMLGAVLLVNLLLRWLNVSERRLALQRALAKREAQLATRAKETPAAAAASETVPPELLKLPDLDLTSIGEQTRSLINLMVLAGLGLGLWWIWSGLVPALSIINELSLWQQTAQTATGAEITNITLGNLLMAAAVLLLVIFLARNLPGVLELLLLQRLDLEPGNHNAIITISRYLIMVIGLVLTLDLIGIGWQQVQWLVAALGVGMGFGLQEIFAKFISGLILLLERPIRVGDTVTLGQDTGVVTRIQIRTTTLVNWDRKEVIVPNKTCITSTLINWTRNDAITRIIIPIGVAYDSDPRQVHQLLLEAARTHPLVLADPAPVALFARFGDSALEFDLYVFVREMANRLPLTHQLHDRIFELLRDHHIEIPFPQRDLHLRSVPPDWQVAASPPPKSTETAVPLKPGVAAPEI